MDGMTLINEQKLEFGEFEIPIAEDANETEEDKKEETSDDDKSSNRIPKVKKSGFF